MPVIFITVVGLLAQVEFPLVNLPASTTPLNLAHVVALGAMAFYVKLAPRLALGMAAFIAFSFALLGALADAGVVVWRACLIAFVLAWIAQFVGHSSLFEGKKVRASCSVLSRSSSSRNHSRSRVSSKISSFFSSVPRGCCRNFIEASELNTIDLRDGFLLCAVERAL